MESGNRDLVSTGRREGGVFIKCRRVITKYYISFVVCVAVMMVLCLAERVQIHGVLKRCVFSVERPVPSGQLR